MAFDKKIKTIVIKRRRAVAHAGHHGGAWKVAYADFVTAMMCFFLVMWLMASDEEVKAAISSYFNNPQTMWKAKDEQSKEVVPVGERTGQGESILNGMAAGFPEDLIEKRPSRAPVESIEANRQEADLVQEVLDGQAYGVDVSLEFMKFSVRSELLFKAGGKELKPEAEVYLAKLGQLFKSFSGYITIAGHTNGAPSARAPASSDPYEFSLARSVAVMHFFVDHNLVTEDRMTPVGIGSREHYSGDQTPEARKKNDRIEFTLGAKKSN